MNKHIIFTNGRSGSNYLLSLLNSHPSIVNFGEVLGEWTLLYKLHKLCGFGGKSVPEYLDNIYKSSLIFYMAQLYSALSHQKKGKKINFKYKNKIATIGVKEFSVNFKRLKLSSFLMERDDILVINLYRENHLKRLVSLEMMSRSGIVSIDKQSKVANSEIDSDSNKIFLDPNYTLRQLEIFQKELEEQMDLVDHLAQERVFNIRFEDLFESDQSVADYTNDLFQFLNIDPIRIKSSHKKILSDRLSDLIANYEEIHKALENSRFACYLDS